MGPEGQSHSEAAPRRRSRELLFSNARAGRPRAPRLREWIFFKLPVQPVLDVSEGDRGHSHSLALAQRHFVSGTIAPIDRVIANSASAPKPTIERKSEWPGSEHRCFSSIAL